MRSLIALTLFITLTGCGLGETAATAGTAAKLKADEAQQAKENMEKIQRQLNENLKQGEQRLQAAEDKN